jgi:hypothetical protein
MTFRCHSDPGGVPLDPCARHSTGTIQAWTAPETIPIPPSARRKALGCLGSACHLVHERQFGVINTWTLVAVGDVNVDGKADIQCGHRADTYRWVKSVERKDPARSGAVLPEPRAHVEEGVSLTRDEVRVRPLSATAIDP